MSFLSVCVVLFLIMDPLGNLSSFLDLLKQIPPKRRRWVILREMGIALLSMLFFYLLGEFLLDLFQVSETTISISSGVILFLAAIQILFPTVNSLRTTLRASTSGEPFIVPLAIPLIAGPSLLATIMLYSHIVPSTTMLLSAILVAWIISSSILLASNSINKTLGSNGLIACERLMGMILVLLAVQRLFEGIALFASNYIKTI